MKGKVLALRAAGVVFLLVAMMHFFRLLWKIQISVAGVRVPLYLSLIGFVLALLLAIWMFTVVGKKE
jgi:hypothetical protein